MASGANWLKAILTAIFCLEERKTNALKWNILQNKCEKYCLIVFMFRNELMVSPGRHKSFGPKGKLLKIILWKIHNFKRELLMLRKTQNSVNCLQKNKGSYNIDKRSNKFHKLFCIKAFLYKVGTSLNHPEVLSLWENKKELWNSFSSVVMKISQFGLMALSHYYVWDKLYELRMKNTLAVRYTFMPAYVSVWPAYSTYE